MLFIIIAITALLTYCLAYYLCHGIPQSLSDTYYSPIGKTFLPITLAVVVVSLLPTSIELVKPEAQWAVFLSLAGLAFVGVTPLHRDNFEGKIHLGAAIVSAIATQAIVAYHFPGILWVWLPGVCILFLPRGRVFWIEMLCFATCITTLLALVLPIF